MRAIKSDPLLGTIVALRAQHGVHPSVREIAAAEKEDIHLTLAKLARLREKGLIVLDPLWLRVRLACEKVGRSC